MTQEVTTIEQSPPPAPMADFSRGMMTAPGMNVGAVSIEQERAIAEARGQIMIAKHFPRDLNAAYAEMMQGCKVPAMAQAAFYTVPRGGGKVSGPSIRLAEELARVCGNIEYGHRELSRVESTAEAVGKSEVEVFAWDKQMNTRRIRQLTIPHVLDTRDGPRRLRDTKDVDDLIANKASKQMRGLILSLVPAWLKEEAIAACKKTLAGDNEVPIAQRVLKMIEAFSPMGVTKDHIEEYLGKKLDDVFADDLVDLHGVFNAIKNEGHKPGDYFGKEKEAEPASDAADAISQANAAGAAEPAKKAAAAKKAEDPKPAAAKAEAKPQEAEKPAAEEKPQEQAQEPAQAAEKPAEEAKAAEPAQQPQAAEKPASEESVF